MNNFLSTTVSIFIGLSLVFTNISSVHSEYWSKKREIDISKIVIGGLKVGMEEGVIIGKLGSPRSRKIEFDICLDSNAVLMDYEGLSLRLSMDSTTKIAYLIEMHVSSPKFKTEKSIRVGDSMAKAERAYGKKAL
jgi:hypothetical protein